MNFSAIFARIGKLVKYVVLKSYPIIVQLTLTLVIHLPLSCDEVSRGRRGNTRSLYLIIIIKEKQNV